MLASEPPTIFGRPPLSKRSEASADEIQTNIAESQTIKIESARCIDDPSTLIGQSE